MESKHKPEDYAGAHEDTKQLHSMGYAQELSRRMSGFLAAEKAVGEA
jgi:hypothetical protein